MIDLLEAIGLVIAAWLAITAVLAIALGVYFLPTLIGWVREVSNVGSVFVVNLFFGGTFVGWVVALAMAARTPTRSV
jgi:hypothetical protein